MNIEKKLFEMQDLKYKEFHSKLMPNINPDLIIGVRIPELRKFAKEIYLATDFSDMLPHTYYEENNLHAFLIEQIEDFNTALLKTEKFLPYIDNWATCDSFLPKAFKKNKEKLLPKIYEWIKSEHTYTVRYAIGLLLKLFLDDDFKKDYPELVAKVKSEEYYINMMIAWYFATALAKQYNDTIPYIEKRKLPAWIHNKTIQKAIESNRITKETKAYLKTFKLL